MLTILTIQGDRASVYPQVLRQGEDQVEIQVWDQVRTQVDDQIWSQFGVQVYWRLRNALLESLGGVS